jgi:hypothetical protein
MPRVLIALTTPALLLSIASAGELDPPAGPVSPTFKTLDEVEPRTPLTLEGQPGDADSFFRITTPGSYYLTEDVLAKGRKGIEIETTGAVTIDLMGFTLEGGPDGAVDAKNGIDVIDARAVTIHNGHLRGFDNAVDTFTGDASIPSGVRIHDLTITGCDGLGVDVGDNAIIERLVITDAANGAINARDNAIIRDVVVDNPGFNGISTIRNAVVERCVVRDATFNGFALGIGSTVKHSTASDNGLDGFSLLENAQAIDCTARSNGTHGFDVDNRSRAMRCVADGNSGFGFDLSPHSVVDDSTITDNSDGGVRAANNTTIRGCTMTNNNGGADVLLGEQSLIIDCTIDSLNRCVQIVGSSVRIIDNHFRAPGVMVGIFDPTFGTAVIERNTFAASGIAVSLVDGSSGCLVIRNRIELGVNQLIDADPADHDLGSTPTSLTNAPWYANLVY